MHMTDYYAVLGVAKDADKETIRKAYLDLARRWHPDVSPDNPEAAKRRFQEINAAYTALSDPDGREVYDRRAAHFAHGAGSGTIKLKDKWRPADPYRKKFRRRRKRLLRTGGMSFLMR